MASLYVYPYRYDWSARAKIPLQKSNIVLWGARVTIGYTRAASRMPRTKCKQV